MHVDWPEGDEVIYFNRRPIVLEGAHQDHGPDDRTFNLRGRGWVRLWESGRAIAVFDTPERHLGLWAWSADEFDEWEDDEEEVAQSGLLVRISALDRELSFRRTTARIAFAAVGVVVAALVGPPVPWWYGFVAFSFLGFSWYELITRRRDLLFARDRCRALLLEPADDD